jgi:hypothetical protein
MTLPSKWYRRFRVRSSRVALCIFLLALCVQTGHACMCGTSPNPCNSLNESDAVFVGTVRSIRTISLVESYQYWRTHSEASWGDLRASSGDLLRIDFEVQESFKGASTKEATVTVHRFVGACGFEYETGLYFKKGERYLVYAFGDGKALSTNHCSRTRIASDAQGEIESLRRAHQLPPSRVFGQYLLINEATKQTPAAGMHVVLTGKDGGQHSESVDRDGHFIFSGLAPDVYRVTNDYPARFVAGSSGRLRQGDDWVLVNPPGVQLSANGCQEIAIEAVPDGHVSGIVVDDKGRPIANVSIRLWNASNVSDLGHWWGWIASDRRGRFDVGKLPPGKYVLGGYVWNPAHKDVSRDDTPTLWFYGGVPTAAKSKTISLSFAQRITNVRLVIPKSK